MKLDAKLTMGRRGFVVLGAGVVAGVLGLAGCSGQGDDAADATTDGAASDELAAVQSAGTMVFATEGTWSPWTYHNEADELVGFDVDVARAVAGKLGVEAQFVEGEWDGLFAGVNAGRYDTVANGVDVTDERAEAYDFSDPYGYNRTVVITLADNDSISSMEDLSGKTTANTISSTYAEIAEGFGATVNGVDDFNQTISLLESGRIDATLNSEVVYYDYLREHADANIKIAATDSTVMGVAFPFRKGEESASLREAVNDALASLREDGTLSELSERYFGTDITSE